MIPAAIHSHYTYRRICVDHHQCLAEVELACNLLFEGVAGTGSRRYAATQSALRAHTDMMKSSPARGPRPGDKARQLRTDLAELIQGIVDGRISDVDFNAGDGKHFRSPGLISMDFGVVVNGEPIYHNLLTAAAYAGQAPLVRKILDAGSGCKPDEMTRSGASPLLAACYGGHASIVSELLQRGADSNVCLPAGALGLTAVEACVLGSLQRGMRLDDVSSLSALTRHRGFLVNGRDAWNRLPLEIAFDHGHWPAASILAQAGANLSLLDSKGRSFADRLKKEASAFASDGVANAGSGGGSTSSRSAAGGQPTSTQMSPQAHLACEQAVAELSCYVGAGFARERGAFAGGAPSSNRWTGAGRGYADAGHQGLSQDSTPFPAPRAAAPSSSSFSSATIHSRGSSTSSSSPFGTRAPSSAGRPAPGGRMLR